jgi:SAM-dependent methyltransferase
MPEASSSVTDVRATMLAHFQGTPSANPAELGNKWGELWDADFLPWDRGQPNPALVDTLREQRDLLGPPWLETGRRGGAGSRRKRALVPGCGRGYDVLLLASFGYDAYGLEISATAVAKCNEFAKQHAHEYPPQPGSSSGGGGGVGKVAFIHGDFFDDSWRQQVEGGSTFELLYDYTVNGSRCCLHNRPPLHTPLRVDCCFCSKIHIPRNVKTCCWLLPETDGCLNKNANVSRGTADF